MTSEASRKNNAQRGIIGCLLGTAVGDALGLPYEGVSRDRAPRLLGPPTRHRFLWGRGMISDDTEHTCMVAQSLIESGDDAELFVQRFAVRLRWWVLAFPAGTGKATLLSGIKLWLGFGVSRCGMDSAGNGPAMRAAILGAAMDDRGVMLRLVRASSRLTHRDPKAHYGATAVALAAREAQWNESIDADRWFESVVDALGSEGAELIELLKRAMASVAKGETTSDFADSLGLQTGVSGYTYHTVPIAIHVWLSHRDDFRRAIVTVIQCGGDADTTAAIVGGIVGAGVGREGIPQDWIAGICDWPRSVQWINDLGVALAENAVNHRVGLAPRVSGAAVLIRNLCFLSIVLFHGFRRLAPPYR